MSTYPKVTQLAILIIALRV